MSERNPGQVNLGLTLRISQIPSTISYDIFIDTIKSLSSGIDPDSGPHNVLACSLVSSAVSADATKFQTATVFKQ